MKIEKYKKHTMETIYTELDNLKIKYKKFTHPPMHTVDDNTQFSKNINGIQIKNLFLIDKKKKMWLITTPSNYRINLKKLKTVLESSGNLSFASALRLHDNLGVKPGSVSPLAVANDGKNQVIAVIDILCIGDNLVCPHPLENTQTVQMQGADLKKFMCHFAHDPITIDFEKQDLTIK